jgi:hypothetical protein
MENIGRLYNARCIKLADLLYTKGKEADSIDLNLEVNADISFEQPASALDDERILHVVEHVLSGLYYMLDAAGHKETHVMFLLKENADNFRMEMFCMEIRDEKLDGLLPILPEKEIFWEKIERTVTGFSISEKPVDAGFAEQILKDILPHSQPKPITVEIIQEKVSSFYKLRKEDLKAKKRTRAVAHPRQIAMFLAREMTDLSLPKIGEEFGGRDHTTVIHAHEKITTSLKSDPQLENIIKTLVERLNND